MTGKGTLDYGFDREHLTVTLTYNDPLTGLQVVLKETAAAVSLEHAKDAIRAKVLKQFKALPPHEYLEVD